MNFGFTVGEFIDLVQLANKLRKDFIGAPTQFKALSDEVRSLSIIIQDIDIALSEWDVCGHDERNIGSILVGCRNVLSALDKALEKNVSIDTSGGDMSTRVKRVWKKVHWQPDDVDDLRSRLTSHITMLNAFLGRISSGIAIETKKGVDQLKQRQAAQDRLDVLNWLTPIDYSTQQHDYFHRRQSGTGQWFLSSSDFRQQSEQTLSHFLASLLRQLLESEPHPDKTMTDVSDRYNKKRDHPQLNDIVRYLHSVTGAYSRIFIIIDALDECSNSDGCRQKLLSELFYLQADFSVNILVTSRFSQDIETPRNSIMLEIRAHDADVQHYTFEQLSKHPVFIRCQDLLQQEIVAWIVEAANGMFLLAQLHVDSLRGKRSIKALRTASQSLATGFEAYDKAYDSAMERIACQSRDEEDLAKHTLLWITFAWRPLTTSELQHALAVEVNEDKFDEECMAEIEDIVSVCAGLVTVDTESKIIRLAHYTTQEYLKRTRDRWFSDVDTHIATICISYISFSVFGNGPCQTSGDLEERLRSYPFYAHAACHWGHYVRATTNSQVCKKVLDLAASNAHVQASAQVLFVDYNLVWEDGHFTFGQLPVLHLMVYFGLEEPFQNLLSQDPYRDVEDFRGRKPLSWAAENGSNNMVHLLLRTDAADINLRDNMGRTPLSCAAEAGHTTTVDLLLTKGAEPDTGNRFGRTPLSYAAAGGHERVVRRLLLENVNLNSKYYDTRPNSTFTVYAVRNNGQIYMHILFGKSLDEALDVAMHSYSTDFEHISKVVDRINEMGNDELDGLTSGNIPLHTLVDPVIGTVELELVRGVRNSAEYGETPLHLAAKHGHSSVVEVLLETGRALPHTRNEFEVTPLISASVEGRTEVLKLLLSTGAVDTRSIDTLGETALSLAIKKGHHEIVKLLAEYESKTQPPAV